MPPLFSRASNRTFRGALVALVLLVLAVPLALMGWVRTPYALDTHDPVEQPVPFDHRHHVRDNRMDCRYCHWTAERAPDAGVPPTELCMNCHNQVLNDSPLLAPVRQSVEEDRSIEWVRVHRLPDFVFFDHSVHLAGGVGCETCHGRVDQMARVSQVAPLTMGWCLDCHRNPEPHLRPDSEITSMGYPVRARSGTLQPGRSASEPDRSAGAVPDASMQPDTEGEPGALPEVSPGTDCTTCHR